MARGFHYRCPSNGGGGVPLTGRLVWPLLSLLGLAACQQQQHRHAEAPVGVSSYEERASELEDEAPSGSINADVPGHPDAPPIAEDDDMADELENELPQREEHEDSSAEDAAGSAADNAADNADDESDGEQALQGAEFEEPHVLDPMPEAQEMLHRARKALAKAEPVEGQHGINFVLHQEVSDLTWVFAVENRGEQPVKLAALPSLIRFEVEPPRDPEAEEEDDEDDDTPAWKKKKKKEEPEIAECEVDLPDELSKDSVVVLEPGQMIAHEFDPRPLCDDPKVLTEGATVVPQYGWPLDTKKLWKKGKLTEVEVEQKEPFVARLTAPAATEDDAEEDEEATDEGTTSTQDPSEQDAEEEETEVTLKHLEAPRFVLGETYPLSSVHATARQAEQEKEDGDEDGEETAPGADEPPEPLAVRVLPMGSSWDPRDDTIRVRIENTSGESMRILLRRELFSYEVIGPQGLRTCRMGPSDRAADPSHFSKLSHGSSRTLVTRLAEACPPDTFDEPGVYSVAARFRTYNSGAEHELDAFVGSATTDKPTRFVVKGKTKEEPEVPAMLVSTMKPSSLSPVLRRRRALSRQRDSSRPIDVGSLMAPRNGNSPRQGGSSNSPNPPPNSPNPAPAQQRQNQPQPSPARRPSPPAGSH